MLILNYFEGRGAGSFQATVFMLLLVCVQSGCGSKAPSTSKAPKELTREIRAMLSVVPPAGVGKPGQAKSRDMNKVRGRTASFVAELRARRATPGYSVRELSNDVFDFMVENGVLLAKYDVTYKWSPPVLPTGEVLFSGKFSMVSVSEEYPPSESSWVAQAAWAAVPRNGVFTVSIPAFKVSGVAEDVIDAGVAQHLGVFLAKDIESHVHSLLAMDGAARLNARQAVYGLGDCTPEVCPKEDGIDSLALLQVAQSMRDVKHLPDYLMGASGEEKEDLALLARRVCAMVVPRDWKSVLRERVKARASFVSKNVVVLQTANGSRTVNRNAFASESEAVLARFEAVAVEFVSKLNAIVLQASEVGGAESPLSDDP